MSTAFWIVWVVAFFVLEVLGNHTSGDRWYTLTNRIRYVMHTNPLALIAVRLAIAAGLLWLAVHFLVVDPALHPGA